MPDTKVIFKESPRDFRTEIPNVIFELLEYKKISYFAFILYSVYRRIAGEHGSCWVGQRGLEEKCGFSRKSIYRAKKELMTEFPELNGKSLIINTPGCKEKSEADTVEIQDIWMENHETFKNKLGWRRGKPGVAPWEARGGAVGSHKNEPLKKEPLKKESIKEKKPPGVPKSEEVEVVEDSIISIDSIPSYEEEEKEDDCEFILKILEKEKEYERYFRPEIMARWINKFGAELTLETLNYFFTILKTSKKRIVKPEAWMESAFKQKYTTANNNAEINKTFAENLKKKHNLKNLKINKRYCIDTYTGNDVYYTLPPEQFKTILQKMLR